MSGILLWLALNFLTVKRTVNFASLPLFMDSQSCWLLVAWFHGVKLVPMIRIIRELNLMLAMNFDSPCGIIECQFVGFLRQVRTSEKKYNVWVLASKTL